MSGWIKLHRKIDKHWTRFNPEYFSVWMWILTHANHEQKQVLIGNQLVDCKKGQFIAGRIKLSDALHISQWKIKKVLDTLENSGEITQQKTNKYTIISVTNWDKYQLETQQTNNSTSVKPTTDQQQINTTKNDKELKNDKKKRKQITSSEVFDSLPKDFHIESVKLSLDKWFDYKKTEHNSGYFTNKSFIEVTSKTTPELLVADIKHSISNNWRGIFPDPEARKPKQQQRQLNFDRNMDKIKAGIERLMDKEVVNG